MSEPVSSPDRTRYGGSLRQFLDRLDQDGLSEVVRRGRTASLDQVMALARRGIVSSSSIRDGEEVWRLRFTRGGRDVRKILLAEAASA